MARRYRFAAMAPMALMSVALGQARVELEMVEITPIAGLPFESATVEGGSGAYSPTGPVMITRFVRARLVGDAAATGLVALEGRVSISEPFEGIFSAGEILAYELGGLPFLAGVTDFPSGNTGLFPDFRALVGSNNADPANGATMGNDWVFQPLSLAPGGVAAEPPTILYKLIWQASFPMPDAYFVTVDADAASYQTTTGLRSTDMVRSDTDLWYIAGCCGLQPCPSADAEALVVRTYRISGQPTSSPWSWRIDAPNTFLLDSRIAGVSPCAGGMIVIAEDAIVPCTRELKIAWNFADSIMARAPSIGCDDDLTDGHGSVGTRIDVDPVSGDTLLSIALAEDFTLRVNGSAVIAGNAPVVFAATIEELTGSNTDCNANGRDDRYDIAFGSSADLNANGEPDECEGPFCACELDMRAGVDVFDLLRYLTLWFAEEPAAERTGDEPPSVNIFDLLDFMACWFDASAGQPCP